MTAGLRQQGGRIGTRGAALPASAGTSAGIHKTGPVWTPDPWGRNKPDGA
jgi:hypothetical protein